MDSRFSCLIMLTLHYVTSIVLSPVSFERLILFNKYRVTENSSLSQAFCNLDLGNRILTRMSYLKVYTWYFNPEKN